MCNGSNTTAHSHWSHMQASHLYTFTIVVFNLSSTHYIMSSKTYGSQQCQWCHPVNTVWFVGLSSNFTFVVDQKDQFLTQTKCHQMQQSIINRFQNAIFSYFRTSIHQSGNVSAHMVWYLKRHFQTESVNKWHIQFWATICRGIGKSIHSAHSRDHATRCVWQSTATWERCRVCCSGWSVTAHHRECRSKTHWATTLETELGINTALSQSSEYKKYHY